MLTKLPPFIIYLDLKQTYKFIIPANKQQAIFDYYYYPSRFLFDQSAAAGLSSQPTSFCWTTSFRPLAHASKMLMRHRVYFSYVFAYID
jgi:hypothetical protein